ncbi:PD40 domain-containing protein [Kordiimonas sp. SCSIO 12603]|uniref:amidohydrolase family protein n=1 Tax=Kordiimonas sp. SCSIO 12603 TaxID=2829596 RepID=UPI002103A2BE|nr:amidohydrolase family protein [Kordiimonas sp. SCSIO 12603]UTW58298.1 PD40 domain-containing protein [Kordiimonas sp. SCSIO 12603]
MSRTSTKALSAALFATSLFYAPAVLSAEAPPPSVHEKWTEPPVHMRMTSVVTEKPGEGGDKKKGLPLEPSRTVEFETDEATWIALDVSPDGSTIMFEILGDIYTMPMAGGEATAVLTGMGFQSQPSYSPDGTEIAFISDQDGSENLYIANADGSKPKKLSSLASGELMSPEWSADGNYVYVSQLPNGIGANEIWMYHKHGGKGIQVTNSRPQGANTPRNRQPNAQGVSVSKDGRYLYYSTKQGGFSYNMSNFPWRVVRRDLQEGTTDTIVTAYGGAMRPAISPDGTMLVYGTRHETDTGFRVRNLATGEDRWLAYPVTRDDQESRATRDLMPAYSFTPDGSAIITTSGGKIERIDIADGKRTVIPFTAKVKLDIGADLVHQEKDPEGPVVARMAQTPAMSPSGDTVVFSALGELYSMQLAEGGTPKKIGRAGNNVHQPSWSKDGRYITYISWDTDGGQIYRMRANGRGKPEQITKISGYYSEPHFTPAGDEIVAIRSSNHQFNLGNAGAQRDLIAVNVKTGATRVIMPGSGFGSIHFGDQADRVNLYDGDKLFSVRLDGTDRRDHLKVTGKGLYFAAKPVPARDMRLSPNGRFALARSQEQLQLINVPPTGRKAVTVNVAGPSVPLKTLSDIGVDYFEWSDDGETILWSVGSTLYTQKLSDVEWVKPEKEESKEEEKAEETASEAAENTDAEKKEEKAEEPKKYQTYVARVEVPRDNPEGTIVLRGATVLTMGEQGTIENADVVVTNGKFAAVGPLGSVDIPRGAEVRDVSGKFITPGFVDSHGHWRNWSRNGVVEENFWPFLANVAYGVTSGLDVQTSTTDIFVAQDMVEAGRMIGLRAWSTGPGVFSDTNIKSKEHAVDVLTRYKDHYRTKNIKAYITGNRKQRQYIVDASKEVGIMPTTEGGLDAKLDLTHMIDGFAGNEHNIPIVPLYKDVVQLAAQTGIGYTPTLLVTYGGPWGENYYFTNQNPHDDEKVNRFMPHNIVDGRTKRAPWFRDEEYAFTRVADSAIDIQRAGGKVGVGSHGQFQGLGYHWELWSLGSGKATPMEALKAATIDGAHIIGHADEVGSIEPGKFADLVVLNKDPRADLKNTVDIHRVMMNGRLYDDDTMNEEWPRKRALPKLWFHDQGPK